LSSILTSLNTCPAAPSDVIATTILADHAFTDTYIRNNRLRIAESYRFATMWLKEHQIGYYPGANAAFFLWVNLGRKWRTVGQQSASENTQEKMQAVVSLEESKVIFKKLLAKKIFVAKGEAFGSEIPGWFRIVFTQPREYMVEGFKRILEALT